MELLCSDCPFSGQLPEKLKGDFNAYHSLNTFTVSLDATSPEEKELRQQGYIDFKNCKLEHVIKDFQSSGYAPRTLVYMQDLKLLAACSFNGRVVFWSIGESVKYSSHLHTDKTIRCVKYIITTEGKRFFLLGTNKEILVYEMVNMKPEAVKVLSAEHPLYDIDYIPDHNRIVSVGCESVIRVWNMENWELERTISIEMAPGQSSNIFTVIYIQDEKKLAVETSNGFSLINFEKQDGEKVTEKPLHYRVPDKNVSGFAYLPKTKQFLMRTKLNAIQLIARCNEPGTFRDFVLKHTYTVASNVTALPGLKFIANETEMQVLCNSNASSFMVLSDINTSYTALRNLVFKSTGIEVLNDQFKFVIGDESSGTLLIYRTNTTPPPAPVSNLFSNNYTARYRPFPVQPYVPPVRTYGNFPRPALNIPPAAVKSNIFAKPAPTTTVQTSPGTLTILSSTRRVRTNTRIPAIVPNVTNMRKKKTTKKVTTKMTRPKKAPKAVKKEKKSTESKDTKEVRMKGKRIVMMKRVRSDSKSKGRSRSKSKAKEEMVYVVFPDERKETKRKKSVSEDRKPERKEKKEKKLRGESKSKEKRENKGKERKRKDSEERSRSRSKSKSPSRPKTVAETIKQAKDLMKKIRSKILTKKNAD